MWQQLREGWLEILNIQKLRRIVSYTGFYGFVTLITFAYTNNTTRAGHSRADQFYASYPAGTELLTDTGKLYKAALGNCFEIEEWGPIEWSILAKILNAKENHRMHTMLNIWHIWPRWGNWTEAAS